ncbi:hypothetical protein BOTBODRAFT_178722 [Botryobasidium botryosum FD-172 SS1]|uniref:Uncharacterized protein n=1 Tax=Botryobasidium botryosum (strain FD-172 SS1) TaxID=930990 RepID=A0A067MD90_BOTB1|nr:hypothetical protein BOTBODRAFT_178722 [Botryobasidium botryosum FD-172 SS1]
MTASMDCNHILILQLYDGMHQNLEEMRQQMCDDQAAQNQELVTSMLALHREARAEIDSVRQEQGGTKDSLCRTEAATSNNAHHGELTAGTNGLCIAITQNHSTAQSNHTTMQRDYTSLHSTIQSNHTTSQKDYIALQNIVQPQASTIQSLNISFDNLKTTLQTVERQGRASLSIVKTMTQETINNLVCRCASNHPSNVVDPIDLKTQRAL